MRAGVAVQAGRQVQEQSKVLGVAPGWAGVYRSQPAEVWVYSTPCTLPEMMRNRTSSRTIGIVLVTLAACCVCRSEILYGDITLRIKKTERGCSLNDDPAVLKAVFPTVGRRARYGSRRCAPHPQ